jgi:hypothetical protein
MSTEHDQDQGYDDELHQTIVEYVASDRHDSGGCLGLISVIALAPLLIAFLLTRM